MPSRGNERTVFNLDWLDNCYHKVKFPNPKCEEFLVEVNHKLSSKLYGELDNEVKQQALFKLLGEDYVRIYFPHHKYQPSLLDPPKTKSDVKEAYIKEMKSLLNDQLEVALNDLNVPSDLSNYEGNDGLGEFLHEIKTVFKDELNKQVEMQTKEEKLKDIEEIVKENEESKNRSKKHRDHSTDSSEDQKQQSNPGIDFQRSNVPGEAFAAAAKMNLKTLEVARKVFKNENMMFPGPVRRIFWEDFIYRNDKYEDKKKRRGGKDRYYKKIDVHEIRRQFRHEVNKKIDLKKIHRAVQSSDYKKIYSVIIDSYYTTDILKPQADDSFMLQAAHVLNILNVVNKTYSNAQIFLLVPLQLTFPQEEDESEELTICRLANDLDLLWNKTHLSWDKIFQVADVIASEIHHFDKEYYKHLEDTLNERVSPVDVYDFAYEILDPEPKRSIKLWNDLYKKKKKDWKEKDLNLFSNLEIFLRKWVSEAFAGILRQNLIMYVWDILFMHKWDKEIFLNIGLAIMFLIKPWAMKANSHRKLSAVLLGEPGKIYIGDLRKAIAYLEETSDVMEIKNSNITLPPSLNEDEPTKEEQELPKVEEEGEVGVTEPEQPVIEEEKEGGGQMEPPKEEVDQTVEDPMPTEMQPEEPKPPSDEKEDNSSSKPETKDGGKKKGEKKEKKPKKDEGKEPTDKKDDNKKPTDKKDEDKEPTDKKDDNKEPTDKKQKDKEPTDEKEEDKKTTDKKGEKKESSEKKEKEKEAPKKEEEKKESTDDKKDQKKDPTAKKNVEKAKATKANSPTKKVAPKKKGNASPKKKK